MGARHTFLKLKVVSRSSFEHSGFVCWILSLGGRGQGEQIRVADTRGQSVVGAAASDEQHLGSENVAATVAVEPRG